MTSSSTRQLAFPPFRLDLDDQRLWNGEIEVILRRKPFAILCYLATNPRRLVTHEELLRHVWEGSTVSDGAVRTHVHELRNALGEGLIETVIGRGYRFTADVQDARTPPSVQSEPTERTLVGRSAELALLHAALERAHGGRRQLCFVIGDPGIGKTTLVDAFVDDIEREDVLALRGCCTEQHGTPEAYVPVIELVAQLRKSARGAEALAVLVRHAPSFLAQLPQFVPDDQLAEVVRRSAGGTEARLVRELIEALEALAVDQTLVLVLEDLQWSDIATIDFVSMLGQRRERARLLVVATVRRADVQTVTHPLNLVMRTLVSRSHATSIAIDRFDRAAILGYLDRRFPRHDLPVQFLETIGAITAGTPIFLVTLLDDLVARGMLVEREGSWTLAASLEDIAAHRPESVKQLVDIQIDRLTIDEQRVLEAGSVNGTEFSTALVAAALEKSIEDVDEVCDSLARRSLFVRSEQPEPWPDGESPARYLMRHALEREVCLARISPVRRQTWHRRIAMRLEAAYPDRVEDVALALATHFDEGQVPERAIHYYLLAAARNEARFASADASSQWIRALEILLRSPSSRERDLRELQILSHLVQVAVRVRSQPTDPLVWFERMVELARRLDDPPRLAAALVDLSYRHATIAGYRRADELLDELEALDRTTGLAPMTMANAAAARAVTLICRGELVRARALVEELLRAPIEADPDHPGILGATDRSSVLLGHLAVIYWITGAPDAAMRAARDALDRDLAGTDPYAIGGSWCTLGRLALLNGDVAGALDAGAHVLAFSGTEVWHAQARILIAWAKARDGAHDRDEIDRSVVEIRERVARFRIAATVVLLPAVELLRITDRTAEAAALVDDMLEHVRDHDERVLESEYLRLRGELAGSLGPDARAQMYRGALASAQRHGARMLELRAALRLAELECPGARSDVEAALSGVVGGDANRDVIAARRFLA